MKQMNNDAKVLIRSYIDNIEEYLKSTCKMHPNEIDTLLNEINDFMYIRSNELATGQETISHSNVLQAMEECGSPSEICDQYLDTESDGTSQIRKTQASPELKLKSQQSTSSSFRGTHPRRDPPILGLDNYLGQLRKFKFFAFYRVASASTFIFAIIMVAMRPFGYEGQSIFSYGNIQYLIEDYLSISSLWFITFLILEGWLIPKWKGRIASKGFARELDDGLLITISRTGFLVLLLKASLLPIPWEVVIIFPILFISQTLLERQLRSHLWIEVLSPFLIQFAHSLDKGESIFKAKHKLANLSSTVQNYSTNERTTLLLGGVFLLFSFLFPWGFGWDDIIFIRSYYYFETERLLPLLIIHLLVVSIILIALIALSFSPEESRLHSKFRLNIMSFWIGRLLGIRTLMMVTAYYYEYYWSFGVFLTLILLSIYVFYEVTIGFQRHLTIKKSIVSGLQYLGQDPVLVSSRKERPPTTDLNSSSSSKVTTAFRSHQQPSSSPPDPVSNNETSVMPLTPADTETYRKSRSTIFFVVSTLYTLLRPVFIFTKALFIALVLLLGTVYEVLLFLLIVLTGQTLDGSYVIPTYSFKFQYNATVQIGGYTIWSWYLLGALAVQIFLLVVIAWFQFIRKRPDGLITIFFRNFSRILWFGLLIGSWYQEVNGDLYAMPRIIILIVLIIFMELTSLKIRLEGRKWRDNHIPLVPDSVTENRPQSDETKTISANRNNG